MNKLNILWTTDNKETVLNMLVMYTVNSKLNGWWEKVNVIIWGASAKLVGTDEQVQNAIAEMLSHGINIEACKACCDNIGVTEQLNRLGINVRYMGESLTRYIMTNEKLITV